jgi:pSer/pThr/pTyr-binding forkhead associated (FHA) protein
MRILGLLSNGDVWEHHIPFSRLAQDGGITIGRDKKAADLPLDENGVSRLHARIELGSTGLVITDLNSTNGLFINNEHINSYSPQKPLTDGAVIRMGKTALRVELIIGSHELHPTSST